MTAKGEPVRLRTAAGEEVDGELFRPPDRDGAPGIVIAPEMYGVNDYVREVAHGWSARGYSVLVFDVLWRIERNLVLAYAGRDNATAHDYHDRFELLRSMPDIQAAIDALRALPGANGKAGIVGFCLGGTLAYLAASRTNVDAASGYYGSRIVEFLGDVAAIRVPLQLHFGAEDAAIPPADRERVTAAAAANPLIACRVHPQARHAFANHVRPDRYHPQAARAAETATADLFRRVLKGSRSQ